jgi:hypothetical protein
MTPFYSRFPELGPRETRSVHVMASGGPLPVGEYSFFELYCEDPGCDCRRVLLQVLTPQAPETPLATINYGWESAAFYTRWMHGDAQAGREITEACLDPLNAQSEYADHLLDMFREMMMTDPDYVARLGRHYEMFKATQRNPAESTRPHPPSKSEKPVAPPGTPAEILRQLQRVPNSADFATYEAALLAAIEQRDAITPELIAAMDRVSADPARYLKDQEDCLHLFAIYLLAQFREPRALDSFLRFFSLPGEQSLDLTGDMVTEHGAAVLASVCGGDPAPLLQLAHDESVNEFVRGQAVNALAVQALWGERPRDAVVEELRRLFRTLPKPGDSYVWAELTSVLCDFHAPELVPEARQAFAEGLVDESVLDLTWFERELSARRGLEDFRERNAPINAVAECSMWLCFRDENKDLVAWDDDEDMDHEEWPDDIIDLPPADLADIPKPTPYIAPPKVGRNESCPCGSGRKYKKCCGK